MKISVLLENTAIDPIFETEHGLSLYIETETHRILFDTGQTDLFAKNATKLGINLQKVDLVVLSHGHYDHGGGLKTFLDINDHAPVYLHRQAFGAYYSGGAKYIGLDPGLASNPRLVFTDDFLRLDSGLELYSCNTRSPFCPLDPAGLSVKQAERHLPETFRHEQYLLIQEGNRRILFSGCAHKGILNLVNWFEPDVLIGGFHFMKLDPDSDGASVLDAAATELARHSTLYYTGHCTGSAPYTFLKSRLGDQLHYLSCGTQVQF